jgi:hypothetical protein
MTLNLPGGGSPTAPLGPPQAGVVGSVCRQRFLRVGPTSSEVGKFLLREEPSPPSVGVDYLIAAIADLRLASTYTINNIYPPSCISGDFHICCGSSNKHSNLWLGLRSCGRCARMPVCANAGGLCARGHVFYRCAGAACARWCVFQTFWPQCLVTVLNLSLRSCRVRGVCACMCVRSGCSSLVLLLQTEHRGAHVCVRVQ